MALGFGLNQAPPAPKRTCHQTLALANVQAIADAIVTDEDHLADAAYEQVENLMLIGTSMGGARPKAVVEDDEGLWIAKFSRPDDLWSNARVEHAMLLLARACGLTMAQSRVIDVAGPTCCSSNALTASEHRGVISALTLLRAKDT